MTSVVVAAGGTGGHIYPGLATAHAIRALNPEARITFIGTPRGLEQRLILPEGFDLELVDMVPWRGARYAPQFAAATVRATAQVLRRLRADAVVAMGGYPSLPTVIAARLRRIPVVIHESGATAGRANRLAAKFTPNIAVSFASANFPRRSPRVTGMPLNPGNLTGNAAAYPQPMVFVTGGSQGSVRLNELAVALAQRWSDIHIVLKTGKDKHVESTGVLQAFEYLDSIGDAYASADVVVTRAGASTVAELAVWGLPSILVPLPSPPSLDDDQYYNALQLTEVDGAVMVRDADATADVVGPIIEDLLAHPDRLAAMGAAARTVGHRDAAKTLAQWVLDLASR